MHHLRQPALGLVSAVAVISASLAFIALFDWRTFSGWVSYGLICTTPTAIIIGTMWRPPQRALPDLRQPHRGAALLAVAASVGAASTAVGFLIIGGSVSPPTPALSQFAVLSIPVTFWLCIVFEGWPLVLIGNRLAVSAGLVVGYYGFTYVFYRGFVSSGIVDGATADAFAVSIVAVMFLMLQFDLWPLTRIRRMRHQPFRGAAWSLLLLSTSAGLLILVTRVQAMAPPVYMASVPIPFIFGSILTLNTLRGSLGARLNQPGKGLRGALIAAGAGGLLALGYHALAPIITGTLSSGAPTYEAATWLASALLGVTFLFLSVYQDFFDFWPIAPRSGTEPPRVR
jgi:hypothetical protein